MSMFFKALEQAERDRNGREREREFREPSSTAAPDATGGAPTAPAVEVTQADGPVPAAPPLDRAAGSMSGAAAAHPTATNASMRAVPPTIPAAPAAAVAGRAVDVTASTPREIDEHLVSLVEPSSFASEQYRVLRHTLEQLHRTAGHSIFGIGSPSASDGKTTTALNLAGALGQAHDARVLLIEADLRCPTMAARLGLNASGLPGLVEAIQSSHAGIADVAQRLTAYNLSVVLAGESPVAPYEILKSPRLGELLDEARRHYDYVVIDTPPIVAFPDCRILNNWVDGWLIVVAAHRTPRKLLEESLDLMEESKTVGFVFTHDERFRANARYYGAYYGARPGRARVSRDG
jgi:capsular exopolysaccharide synthesis family protein